MSRNVEKNGQIINIYCKTVMPNIITRKREERVFGFYFITPSKSQYNIFSFSIPHEKLLICNSLDFTSYLFILFLLDQFHEILEKCLNFDTITTFFAKIEYGNGSTFKIS